MQAGTRLNPVCFPQSVAQANANVST